MPEISISDDLYRQLLQASGDDELDQTMWQMVYSFRRGNNPGD